ncbi:MAG: MerC domain-containing protein [Cyanobacteria bacterium HKST-UBA02]|nr:MerC domain-containing protein [Cyanobacteria bacterium HKST-UBA02]
MTPEPKIAPKKSKRSEDKAESSCCGGHAHGHQTPASHGAAADQGVPVAITTGMASAGEPSGHDCAHDHGLEHAHAHEPGHEDGVDKAILSLDNLGIIASVGCLIHCAALPFVVAFLPVMGLGWLDSHESHQYLAAFIIGFAILAVVPAYFRHRRTEVLVAMIVGMSLVVTGALFIHHIAGEQWELPLMVAGNLTLVAAHWRNKMLVKCCAHEH